MLINEFDLDLDVKDEFLIDNKSMQFYWRQVRDKVKTDGVTHMKLLSKRHQKGIYRISPNYTIVIK